MKVRFQSSVSTPGARAARRARVTLLLTLALAAAGCGQKGPLRLPAPGSTANPAPAATPASAPTR